MKKRIPELDFIKGIAIILVVIGHVISQVWNTSPEVYENTPIFRFCYSFHMPLFVFISGWISRLTMKINPRWLLRRIRRIGIPYILATALVFIYLRHGDISQFITSTPYWYLIFVIIADSIFFLGAKRRLGTAFLVPLYMAALLITLLVPQDIGIFRQLADFLPFYAAGTFMPKLPQKTEKLKFPVLIGSGTLYIAVFRFYRHGISGQLKYCRELFSKEGFSRITSALIIILNKFAVPLLGIGMIFLLTEIVYSLKSARKLRFVLEKTGNHTLTIYLLHDLFFIRPFANPLANSVISVFTAIFIPLILSVAYQRLKKKLRK